MSDDKLIEMVARLWVVSGGDADGFCYCWQKIKDKIVELSK